MLPELYRQVGPSHEYLSVASSIHAIIRSTIIAPHVPSRSVGDFARRGEPLSLTAMQQLWCNAQDGTGASAQRQARGPSERKTTTGTLAWSVARKNA